ncbi:MAG: protein phosphatase [Gammaproteobacteria bacterium]|jgi:protein phosphatase
MLDTVTSWRSALRSEVGNVRKHNEDSGLDRPDVKLWAVADGMGGHSAGDLASQMIVNALNKLKASEYLSEHVDFVEHSILSVNNRLLELSKANNQTIGSTLVTLIGGAKHCVFMWAGDSRLYRLRDGTLDQLTTDHTQAQHYYERGLISRESAVDHPAGNMVTRAVGASSALFLDIDIVEIIRGDRFLLCSDGLDKHVSDAEIETAMRTGGPAIVVDQLVDLTLSRGASDNVTVCVVDAVHGR